MARALARGDDPLSSRVDALINDRLARLDEGALALVPWVATYGRAVAPSMLAAIAERDAADLFGALGVLERHGVLQADVRGDVDFVHDLVRTAAYTRLSAPRRAVLHAVSPVCLPPNPIPTTRWRPTQPGTPMPAGTQPPVVRPARAPLGAAFDCSYMTKPQSSPTWDGRMPVYSNRRARVHTEIALIHVMLHPGIRLRDPGELRQDLTELCADAQRLGLEADLSVGLNLLARVYHWGWGDIPRAKVLHGACRPGHREQPRAQHRAAAGRGPLPCLPRDGHAPHRTSLR